MCIQEKKEGRKEGRKGRNTVKKIYHEKCAFRKRRKAGLQKK